MNEIKLILATHLSYFRRHPWLFLLFIVGLSLGSALLTAIAGLNQEAKNRHQKTSALIDATVSHLVKPPIGQDYLDGKIWLTLRQQGLLTRSRCCAVGSNWHQVKPCIYKGLIA
ncbi:MAG: hypothetical protein U5L01_10825 [Rheinheimera sp.]|nr:hypothetical protein [Rheinheimera sp.]